jgi:hypothetical protein
MCAKPVCVHSVSPASLCALTARACDYNIVMCPEIHETLAFRSDELDAGLTTGTGWSGDV